MNLVDADYLYKMLDEKFNVDLGQTLPGTAAELLRMIEEQPTIVLIRHGKWNEHHQPFTWMGYTTWTCSECDYECGYEKEIGFRTPYCPNCGAKMDNN